MDESDLQRDKVANILHNFVWYIYIYIYTVTPVDYTSYESKTGRTFKLLRDVITVAFITFYHNVKFAIKACRESQKGTSVVILGL